MTEQSARQSESGLSYKDAFLDSFKIEYTDQLQTTTDFEKHFKYMLFTINVQNATESDNPINALKMMSAASAIDQKACVQRVVNNKDRDMRSDQMLFPTGLYVSHWFTTTNFRKWQSIQCQCPPLINNRKLQKMA